jgi:purine-binding chemotaxis protein CheW
MEDAEAILAARARRLARPRSTEPEEGATREIVAFVVGRERWGIDSSFAVALLRRAAWFAVPGAPPAVLGAVLHQGLLVPAVDLRRLFHTDDEALPSPSALLLVGEGQASLGLVATGFGSISRCSPSSIHPTPRSFDGSGLVTGYVEGALALLDGHRLLRDPRLFAGKQRED